MTSNIPHSFATLRAKVASLANLPNPYWIKKYDPIRDDFVMVYLNDAYEEDYLISVGKTKDEYIGKTDTEFWGAEVAEAYNRHDREILTSKSSDIFKEKTEAVGIAEIFVKSYYYDEQTDIHFIAGQKISA